METPYLCFYAALPICALLLLFPRLCQFLNVNSPPGSLGFPLIGETVQFMAAIRSNRGFYHFVRVRSLRYGSCFKTSIFGSTHVFVSTTESARMILNNESGKFTKRYIRSIGELVGENSVLCASQQHHKLIRSRLMNLVSPSSLGTFIPQFDQLIVRSLESWPNDSTVVLLDQALQITFEAMCKMLMGLEGGHEMKSLYDDVSNIYKAMLAFPLRLPWTRFNKGLKARERVMKRLENMMSERRERPTHEEQDFLQQLIGEEGSSKLTDEEIKDNILTMIIAGQDTTASAMTWIVKYLGDNPDVADALREDEGIRASSFMGFGMGGRTCLGMNLAKSMLLVFLHRLLTSYK
ncbi:Abscisic acid 8'-hydroxylase CYP707A1 [Linum perenne]